MDYDNEVFNGILGTLLPWLSGQHFFPTTKLT